MNWGLMSVPWCAIHTVFLVHKESKKIIGQIGQIGSTFVQL